MPGVFTDLLNRCHPHDSPLNTPQPRCQDQLSIRSSRSTYLEKDLLHLLLRFGPTDVPRRHNSLLSNDPKPSSGYGLSIATAFRRYRPFSLELAIFLTINSIGPGIDCSIQWRLSWPRIVSWDNKVLDLALCGDIHNMKRRNSPRKRQPHSIKVQMD